MHLLCKYNLIRYSVQVQTGSRCTAVLVLTLGVRWGCVVNTMPPAALSPVKCPDTDCKEGWTDSRAYMEGCVEEEICCPTAVRTPNRPAHNDSLTD